MSDETQNIEQQPKKVCSMKIDSKTEITDVYHMVMQDVIKNMKGVFKEEQISLYVLQDLETLWTSKFLKMRRRNISVTLVPMMVMIPPRADTEPPREIELMVPQHEAELLDFRRIFSEGIMSAVASLSDETAKSFLQQRINKFCVSRAEVEDMISMKQEPEMVPEMEPEMEPEIKQEIEPEIEPEIIQEIKLEIKQEPPDYEEFSQIDGANDTSDEDEGSDDTDSSQKSQQADVNESSCGSDGETLNSDDDVTDEDIEALFDCDNVILCQYLNVLRCKNKWRFYFKDAIMCLDGCDFAFHKILGDAPW